MLSVRRQVGARSAIVAFAVMATACSSVVTDHYETLQEARSDDLFQRGWLPDILPPSAHDIRTSNNLDINVSEGEFHFRADESAAFFARLQSYTRRDSPLDRLDDDIERLKRSGYEPYELVGDHAIWVFICKPHRGTCEYRMWSTWQPDV
jgi:hypothetical protein